jgi:uncharacterized protein (TIGR00730 family)
MVLQKVADVGVLQSFALLIVAEVVAFAVCLGQAGQQQDDRDGSDEPLEKVEDSLTLAMLVGRQCPGDIERRGVALQSAMRNTFQAAVRSAFKTPHMQGLRVYAGLYSAVYQCEASAGGVHGRQHFHPGQSQSTRKRQRNTFKQLGIRPNASGITPGNNRYQSSSPSRFAYPRLHSKASPHPGTKAPCTLKQSLIITPIDTPEPMNATPASSYVTSNIPADSNICVFCGSAKGISPAYTEQASALGRILAENGYGIVYGGAHVGLMGAVADAAMAAGGNVTGVIPQTLVDREVAHTGLTALHVVPSMHERKALMAELSGAFVALPGGFGTLDEFCEIVTWALLGLHTKPCLLLNTSGYWDSFLKFLDDATGQGFIHPESRPIVQVANEIPALLTLLKGPA